LKFGLGRNRYILFLKKGMS
jgi:hypothetical protein